jgi:uncharacterized alkaline shock family protein YloU
VSVKIEVNIKYGISIPEKAEEIQSKIIESISKYTGLHVNCVHVIFKNLVVNSQDEEDTEDHEEEGMEAYCNNEEYEGF